jgi:hypothetical protein
MNSICIVIPIHSPSPSANELISLRQCHKVLGNYSITLVAPMGLDIDSYRAVIPACKVMFIDPTWQGSLIGYNKLKMSKYFYKLFSAYEFMLTYELDAFIFKDELAYWCMKGYDYIGAPWFEGFNKAGPDANLLGVGNSGFSLRRISSVRRALDSVYYRNPQEYATGRRNRLKAYLKEPYRRLQNKIGENPTIQASGLYEDIFFSEVVPKFIADFRIAPIEEAIKFSFEVRPERLFILNSEQLPMGCHAWWRYNFEFWKPFIEGAGYTL